MSYKKIRIDYNNNWPDKEIEFSGQIEFIKLLKSKNVKTILKPIQIPLIEDFQFQRLLSFKIDIYEQLPNRPDIAFDLAWRNFEAYCSYFASKGQWSVTKIWKVLNKVNEDILINQINNNIHLSNALNNLLKCVPLQATEFLVKRLFEAKTSSIKSQQNQIKERFLDSVGDAFYNEFKAKYGNLTPQNQRNAGLFLQLVIYGKKVNFQNGKSYELNRLQIIKLLINSILYTYRNERFHGDSFSPFKSSRTQIKTYAHSYFCLISTYFFITQLIYHHFPNMFDLNVIAESLNENITRYNLIFSKHLKK